MIADMITDTPNLLLAQFHNLYLALQSSPINTGSLRKRIVVEVTLSEVQAMFNSVLFYNLFHPHRLRVGTKGTLYGINFVIIADSTPFVDPGMS